MVSIDYKNKLVVIGLTILSFVVVFINFAIVKQEIAKNVVRKEELAVFNKDLANLDALFRDYESRREDIEKLLISFPSTYDEVAIYADKLDSLANDYNVSMESNFDQKTKTESEGVESLGVTLTATGSYEDLIEFINNVSNLPYHIRVVSLSVGSEEGILTLNFSYKLFVNLETE